MVCVVDCVLIGDVVNRLNLGRGRLIPKHHTPFYVHRSVKTRMEAQGLKGGVYLPKAQYVLEPIWVD